MADAKTMTPAELATELNRDGKTVRKFLRSITPKDEQPGKGPVKALLKRSKAEGIGLSVCPKGL